ncbi:high light inducible protein [Nostoc sp. MG11]|uniref:high light inducible protein n=1 Tax=Nostoc sp. MG11 TaxID=2721166 RepID=UPI0018661A78|nr:high light inducible protein [Nostoc sp. MG11]
MKISSNFDEQSRLNNFAIAHQMYVSQQSQFGFTEYAEKLNSRLAMIGFVFLVVLEVLTGHGAISFFTSF